LPLVRTGLAAIALVVALGATAPALRQTARAGDEVVVRSGDTLSAIAVRHGVAVSALAAANGITDPNRIYAGQRLVVTERSTSAPASTAATAARRATTHTVKPGDNLWSIARFYGVSLSALVAANKITDPSRIRPGMKLTIPGSADAAKPKPKPVAKPAPPAPGAARTHIVKRGESLWSIGRTYGVSVSALVAANRISDPSRLKVGQRLTVPGSAAGAPSPKPNPNPKPAPPPAPDMPEWMTETMAKRDGVRRIIVAEAKAAGVPVALALAVAWQESGWRQNVVSSAGAVGVMQLMPGTAEWIGESMLGRPLKINDTRDNVRGGVTLLAHYLRRYDGNRDLVLAAYYQGQGAVDRHGIYPVSRPYIASIKALVRLFGG
jgi:N-acetylmuramoyl-L-alanine amidase